MTSAATSIFPMCLMVHISLSSSRPVHSDRRVWIVHLDRQLKFFFLVPEPFPGLGGQNSAQYPTLVTYARPRQRGGEKGGDDADTLDSIPFNAMKNGNKSADHGSDRGSIRDHYIVPGPDRSRPNASPSVDAYRRTTEATMSARPGEPVGPRMPPSSGRQKASPETTGPCLDPDSGNSRCTPRDWTAARKRT